MAGEGGGGGNTSNNFPEYPVNADSARTLIGGTPLNLNSDQISRSFVDAVATADTALASDILHFFDTGTVARVEADCGGQSCRFTGSGVDFTIAVSGLTAYDEFQAVATHNGIPIAQGRSRSGEFGYGGWLDHSVFGGEGAPDVTDDGVGFTSVYAISFGDSPGTNPTGSGTATWTGVMVGADVGTNPSTVGNVIHGDAQVTVDFSDTDVDVAFTDLIDLDTGRSRSGMTWRNMPMSGGGFRSGNQIEGRFYGPNHEEVGGVFERNQILGAFGAKRD